MNTETRVETAKMIAEQVFKDLFDKGGEPYIGHLERVASYCKKYNDSYCTNDITVIAYLHDILRDYSVWTPKHLEDIFGRGIITESIKTLTKRKGEDYETYISNIAKNPLARIVKLADLEDNMSMSRLPEITEKDIERLKKYHKAYTYLKNYKKE